MDLEKLQGLINDDDIEVITLHGHSKASELYVEVAYHDRENQFKWSGLIPYHYRRTALFIESEEALSEYLIGIKPYFKKDAIREWIKQEKELWRTKYKGKYVTKPFFDELAKMKWTSKFPPFGIKYFYESDENWPDDVPKIGKDAEQGCVGCGWYDIQKWRVILNELIKSQ